MLDVVEDLFLAEVDEDCVLLNLETVDLQEDVVLLVFALRHSATVDDYYYTDNGWGRTHRPEGDQPVSEVLGTCSVFVNWCGSLGDLDKIEAFENLNWLVTAPIEAASNHDDSLMVNSMAVHRQSLPITTLASHQPSEQS